MIYILFFIFILMIFIGFKLTKKFFNPLSMYNVVWFIVILLYQFRLSRLQHSLTNDTILLFLVSTLVFSFGFLIIYCTKLKDKQNVKSDNNTTISSSRVRGLFNIWLLVEIVEIIYSGGVPILWILGGSSKNYMDFGIPTVHGLMNSFGLVIIMLLFYLILEGSDKKNNRKNILMLVFCILFYTSLITRQVIISAVIQMIIIFVFFKRNIPWIKLLILSFFGIIMFGILGNVRTGYQSFINVSLIDTNVNPIFIGIYWVYMYLTMSVANINNAVLLGINHYGGFYNVVKTFLPTVFSNFLFDNANVYIPDYLVTKAYNVSGYFINFYIGLGNIGVYLIAAIYGILGATIFKKLTKNQNEKNLLYYAVYMQIILLSFFYNHLLYLPSGFQFVVIYIIFKFTFKLKK